MRKIYKTIIEIYSDEHPGNMELVDIAREATEGEFICGHQRTFEVSYHAAPEGVKEFLRAGDEY